MTQAEYIQKWLNGTLSEEELRMFEQTDDYSELTRMDESLQMFKAPPFNADEEYQRLQGKLAGRKARTIHWSLKLAAVITLLISGYVIFFTSNTLVLETGLAQKRTVILPDSSLVILNAESRLEVDEKKWPSEREVLLFGEAFFQVAKGSTFTVITETGEVTVLGTEFNVKDRASYFEVICYEGLVGVLVEPEQVELPRSYVLRRVDGEVTVEKDDFFKFPHLLKNESAFNSTAYAEVLDEFERHFDYEIDPGDTDLKQNFTGRFAHGDMEVALQAITLPLNLSYKIDPQNKKIILSGAVN
jgi:transmembrane sensor